MIYPYRFLKKLLLFSICFILQVNTVCFAQPQKAERILQKIKQAPSNTDTRKLQKQFRSSLSRHNCKNLDEAQPFINQLLTITQTRKEQEYLLAQVIALWIQNSHLGRLDIVRALDVYNRSEEKNFLVVKAEIAYLLGTFFMYTSKKADALSYILESSEIFEKLNLHADASVGYYHACMLNYWGNNTQKAQRYYDILKDRGFIGLSKREHINIVNTGGLIAKRQKLFEKAIKEFEKAIVISEEHADSVWIGIANGNIGDVYCDMELYPLAIPYLEKDLYYSKKYEEYGNVLVSLNQLGMIAQKEGDTRKALAYFNEALSIINASKKNMAPEQIARTFENLAQVNKKIGLNDQAYKYLKQSIYWKDSLNSVNREAAILEIQKGYDYEHQEKALEALQKEQLLSKKNEQLKVQFAFLGFGILSLILLYFWFHYRKQKQLNQLLNKQNKEITLQKRQIDEQRASLQNKNEELEKRELIFRDLLHAFAEDEKAPKLLPEEIIESNEEIINQVTKKAHEVVIKNKELKHNNSQLEQFNYVIAHNIRGPLARLLGLLQLYESTKDPQEKSLYWSKINSSANDIDGVIKDLNTTILLKKNIQEMHEEVNLAILIRRVLEILSNEIDESQAQFDIDLAVVKITSVKAYLESILYNLISNAIKYRDPQKALKITIRSNYDDKNKLIISVQDNGLGIDLEKHQNDLFGMYKRFHIHTEGKGLGLHLVKLQVESLDGHIAVESSLGEGSSFKIYL